VWAGPLYGAGLAPASPTISAAYGPGRVSRASATRQHEGATSPAALTGHRPHVTYGPIADRRLAPPAAPPRLAPVTSTKCEVRRPVGLRGSLEALARRSRCRSRGGHGARDPPSRPRGRAARGSRGPESPASSVTDGYFRTRYAIGDRSAGGVDGPEGRRRRAPLRVIPDHPRSPPCRRPSAPTAPIRWRGPRPTVRRAPGGASVR